jgi:hypothetical protein
LVGVEGCHNIIHLIVVHCCGSDLLQQSKNYEQLVDDDEDKNRKIIMLVV